MSPRSVTSCGTSTGCPLSPIRLMGGLALRLACGRCQLTVQGGRCAARSAEVWDVGIGPLAQGRSALPLVRGVKGRVYRWRRQP